LLVFAVPANAISLEETRTATKDGVGDTRLANVVTLGTLVQATSLLPLSAIETTLERHLPQRHHMWLEPNRRALHRGAALVEEVVAS
jgi:Pyruvate/2-oxoacid:ferredoxin oxidoreductase gamma subunit